jgi:hypothetical protein
LRKLRLMFIAGAMAASFGGATIANATHTTQAVQHATVPGNPQCSVGTILIKVEPVASGTYGKIAVVVTGDSFSWTITDNTATGLDANVVIVKGGPNAEVYQYPDIGGVNSYDSDSGLTAPINPKTGRPYGLSHIEFCFDPKGA